MSLSPLRDKGKAISLMGGAVPLKLLRKQFIYSAVYVINNRGLFSLEVSVMSDEVFERSLRGLTTLSFVVDNIGDYFQSYRLGMSSGDWTL